jgi:uncharacterized protein (DUF697 family)/predicted GTPase
MSRLDRIRQAISAAVSPTLSDADVTAAWAELRSTVPTPVVWLFGRTQSGKSSIVRFLTGAPASIVGMGFRPHTATTLRYPFPDAESPIVTFLDTRGVDDAQYEPTADIAACGDIADVILVTAKIGDFAQGTVIAALRAIRSANLRRPVILVLTCLHEVLTGASPDSESGRAVIANLLAEQQSRFDGLVDEVVCVDLTRPEEGFAEPNYNGEALQTAILKRLPAAFRGAFVRNREAVARLNDLHDAAAGPLIAAHAALAAGAAAIPVPVADLVLIPIVQMRLAYRLAQLYRQDMSRTRLFEMASTLGIGIMTRQAVQSLAKLVPIFGSAVAATTAFASTYAWGKALAIYFQRIHEGHLPTAVDLKSFYAEQLATAKSLWGGGSDTSPDPKRPGST